METKMIEKINAKIAIANKRFTEWNEAHRVRMAEIDGMIDMLAIVTGKNYVFTENGLKER